MGEEWHVQQLTQHCRVCGNRIQKAKKGDDVCRKYACVDLVCDLRSFLKVDTTSDTEETHPPYICRQCYNALQKCKLAQQKGENRSNSITAFTWEAHCDNCNVCLK